jgi:hypothetical protein
VSRSRHRLTMATLAGVALATTGLLLAQRAGSESNDEQLPVIVTEEMMDAWCVEEYGGAFRASNVRGNDPFQWRCWGRSNGIVTDPLIPMDELCSSVGPKDAVPRVVAGPTGWECSPEP